MSIGGQKKSNINVENIGLILALIPCFAFIIVAIGFALGIKLSPVHFPLAVLITILFVHFISKEKNILSTFYSSLIAIIIQIICTWIAIQFYDISFDGQWYHSQVVLALDGGWNPFYGYYYSDIPRSQNYPLWLNHYPNAAGYAKAAVFSITGNLESIKCFNLTLAIGSCCIVYSTFKKLDLFGPAIRVIISIVLAINPIVIGEVFSNYIDGQLYSVFLLIICMLIAYIKSTSRYLVFTGIFTLYLINIKYPGVFYLVIIFSAFVIYLLIIQQSKKAFASIGVIAAFFIIGFFALGYPTYVKNYTEKGHPFYPVMGKDKKDIGEILYPADFFGKNRFEKFVRSNMAWHGPSRAPLKSDVRRPVLDFRINHMEVYELHVAEISGFGPANNELFCLWVVGVLILGFVALKSKKHRLLLGITLAILISVLINPEAWVARYAPQFYICFVLAAIGLIIHSSKIIKLTGYSLLAVLVFNTVLISAYYFPAQSKYTREIDHTFHEMKQSKEVFVRFGFLVSHRERFKESGVKWIEDLEFDSAGWTPFPHAYNSTSYRTVKQ